MTDDISTTLADARARFTRSIDILLVASTDLLEAVAAYAAARDLAVLEALKESKRGEQK